MDGIALLVQNRLEQLLQRPRYLRGKRRIGPGKLATRVCYAHLADLTTEELCMGLEFTIHA